jgi:para-aminobenzoate synthetase / 4-amino-4-deoxychorismate lyase
MPHLLLPAADGRWLRLQRPERQFQTLNLAEVRPMLREIETAVNDRNWWAAGFISYEAAPAFDPALTTRPPTAGFPLLWFGLFAPENVTPVALPPHDSGGYQMGAWQATVDEAAYRAAIAAIKEHIAQGQTYQVNYTFRQRADFRGEPSALFLDLYRAQQSPHAAYIELDDWAICSASPELFFTLDGRNLTCRPMKGTAARGLTLADDDKQADWLRHSEKNRAENVMIVDMIRNDLGRVAELGSVRVPHLFTAERYPTLWQMTSTVTAVSPAPWSDIMTALFPCASITGAPKARTMRLIANLETTPRGVYCGAIGYLAPGRQSRFNVAIRTVTVDRRRNQAEYGVGSGIVWDSLAEDEYAECRLKARLIAKPQPPFELLETLRWQPGAGYFLLDYHLRRLGEAAVYFNIPLDTGEIGTHLHQAVAQTNEPAKVRLLVSQSGQIGTEVGPTPAAPWRTVNLAAQPIDRGNPFLYHKTTRRDLYAEARNGRANCDDTLLWNESEELTEATTANVVVQYQGKWLTPPISAGLLPGVMRQFLLDQGTIREAAIPLRWLPDCEQIVLINSLRGWQPVTLCDAESESDQVKK